MVNTLYGYISMTDNHKRDNISNITSKAYRQHQYETQMESWLEFAWENKDASTYRVRDVVIWNLSKAQGGGPSQGRGNRLTIDFYKNDGQTPDGCHSLTRSEVINNLSPSMLQQKHYIRIGKYYYFKRMLWENWKAHYREAHDYKSGFYLGKVEGFHELMRMADFMEDAAKSVSKPNKSRGPITKGPFKMKKKSTSERRKTKNRLIREINEYEHFKASPDEWTVGDLRKKIAELKTARRKTNAASVEKERADARLRFLNRSRYSQKMMVDLTMKNKKFLTSLPRGGNRMPSARQLLLNFALDQLALELGNVEIEYNDDTKEFGVWAVSDEKDDIYWWQPLTDILNKVKYRNRYARRKRTPGFLDKERKRKKEYRTRIKDEEE